MTKHSPISYIIPIVAGVVFWWLAIVATDTVVDCNYDWLLNGPAFITDLVLVTLAMVRSVIAPIIGVALGMYVFEYRDKMEERRIRDERIAEIRRRHPHRRGQRKGKNNCLGKVARDNQI